MEGRWRWGAGGVKAEVGTKCVGITIVALAPKSRRPFLVAKVFMIAQRLPPKLETRGNARQQLSGSWTVA